MKATEYAENFMKKAKAVFVISFMFKKLCALCGKAFDNTQLKIRRLNMFGKIRIVGNAILITCFILLMATAFCSLAFASNLNIENGALEDKDVGADTYDIEFDISWDNSWRGVGAPSLSSNWDAVWVFAKHSTYNAATSTWHPWNHATLLNTGSVTPGNSSIEFADNAGDTVYRGAFVYRTDADAGSGSNDWDAAQIRWDYGADGVVDGDTVRVKVFGIEMVYVPTGSFYVGDTDCDNDGNIMLHAGCGGTGVRISTTITAALCTEDNGSDVDIECGGASSPGTFCIDGDGGFDLNAVDGVCDTIDNANFPTGYNAFYVQKYEVTQKQYVDFLNTLNGTQQANRASAVTVGNFLNTNDTTSVPPSRCGMKVRTAPVGSVAGLYGNDLDDDDIYGESNDGQWLAANLISWMDDAAYADWAALRPMTELEFEKAARGGQSVVDDEYACGSSNGPDGAYSLSDEGANNEAISANYENDPECNQMDSTSDGAIGGPVRVGIFADNDSTRAEAGMGYYGAMELSGNLWERTVTIGNDTGRDFTGVHGDGVLSTAGHANEVFWPGLVGVAVTGATGSGLRGGSWIDSAIKARVSYRSVASAGATNRLNSRGFRGARTAP